MSDDDFDDTELELDVDELEAEDLDEDAIVEAVRNLIEDPKAYEAMSRVHNPYGDGRASSRISDAIGSFFSEKWERKPVSFPARLP